MNTVEAHQRYVEIYCITCTSSGKSYIGQVVSHVLNHGKYRRKGMHKRFMEHVSESFSDKKNQCHFLNNAIRKYGPSDFTLTLLTTCSLQQSDTSEALYIDQMCTMFPNGYNLKLKTTTTRLSLEGRRRLSNGVYRHFEGTKQARFSHLTSSSFVKPLHDYIKPLRRHEKQYGWYVWIESTKAYFGGVHMDLNLSYQRAFEFLQSLHDVARPPVAGSP